MVLFCGSRTGVSSTRVNSQRVGPDFHLTFFSFLLIKLRTYIGSPQSQEVPKDPFRLTVSRLVLGTSRMGVYLFGDTDEFTCVFRRKSAGLLFVPSLGRDDLRRPS